MTGDETKLMSCEQCDKVYHASCQRPVVTSIPKYGWKCRVRWTNCNKVKQMFNGDDFFFSVAGCVGTVDHAPLGPVCHHGGTLTIQCAIRVTSKGIKDSRVLCVIERIVLMPIGRWCSARCVESE